MKRFKSKLIFSLGLCLLVLTHLDAKDIYVDASEGDDNNPGTLDLPFRTIQQAADTMAAGDVCHIRCGIYREKVTINTDGLTFKNYNNEYVVITGLDAISGADFTSQEGGVLKTTVEHEVKQVFIGGNRMNWARWPNEDGNMLNRADMVQMDASLINRDNTNLGRINFMVDSFPQRAKDY